MVTERAEIRIQRGQQFLQQNLHGRLLLFCEQSALVGPSEEMPDFVKRTPRGSNESLVIGGRGTSIPLGNIRAYAVCSANELMPDRGLRKRLPTGDHFPNQIGQFLCHRVNPQFVERELRHVSSPTVTDCAWRQITNF